MIINDAKLKNFRVKGIVFWEKSFYVSSAFALFMGALFLNLFSLSLKEFIEKCEKTFS